MESKADISAAELASLIDRYAELEQALKPFKDEMKPLDDERKGLKQTIKRVLEFVPNHVARGRNKQVALREKQSFRLPSTDEDLDLFLSFVVGRGEIRSLLRSEPFVKYCQEVYAELAADPDILEPEIPGVEQPTLYYDISITNAKEV